MNPVQPQQIPGKKSWQSDLSDLITNPQELLEILHLDMNLLAAAQAATTLFPLKVSRDFVARIEKGNLHDPLLKQILPMGAETVVAPGFAADPLQEKRANPIPGLLHKYHGRVLVTLTSACAVHCRYCFRRSFPYAENNPGLQGWEKMFAYIANDASITEVILSGGDPLAVSDKLLQQFTDALQQIEHVKRLRLHTRLPVMLPNRITPEFIAWITQVNMDKTVVLHINHQREMSADVKSALLALKQHGVQLLNQSVLLRGVNDDVETLVALSETLFSAGVLPYYLHVLDKVQGTAHFDLPTEQALALHAAMMKRLPCYLVPKLAREEAGKSSKTMLAF